MNERLSQRQTIFICGCAIDAMDGYDGRNLSSVNIIVKLNSNAPH